MTRAEHLATVLLTAARSAADHVEVRPSLSPAGKAIAYDLRRCHFIGYLRSQIDDFEAAQEIHELLYKGGAS